MRVEETCHGRNGHIRLVSLDFSPLPHMLEIHLIVCFSHQVGLKGEALSLHSLTGSSSVDWIQGSLVTRKQPLTWFKVRFLELQNNLI